MRLNRFFGDFDFSRPQLIVSDKEFYNQLKNVLRLNPGDKIILCDGKNNEADGTVISLEKSGVKVELSGIRQNLNEFPTQLTVYCAVLKRENFEIVAQKITEIGAYKLVPVITKRTVKQDVKIQRLEAIIKEAAEQSGRGALTKLGAPVEFREAIKIPLDDEVKILFDVSGQNIRSMQKEAGKISIFIGPEGGWDESEMNLARENNFKIVSLGKFVLRGETAAIVASYMILNR